MHRRGIDWAERICAALVTLILGAAHARLFGVEENTKFAVSVYLGTSALFNFAAILCYARILRGKLSIDLQHLALCAIILNFLGWITYMFQLSPQEVNILTEALTYGTFTRLLWISDGDFDLGGWRDLFRRCVDWWMGIHFRTTQS